MLLGIQTKISTQCLYYQSHGRVDTERYQSVLRIRRGETKGIYIYTCVRMCIYLYINAYVRERICVINVYTYFFIVDLHINICIYTNLLINTSFNLCK